MNEATTPPVLTRGQALMGVTFNPDQRKDIAEIKQAYANLFDLLDKHLNEKLQGAAVISSNQAADIGRAMAVAKTELQQSKMWAIEAVTR